MSESEILEDDGEHWHPEATQGWCKHPGCNWIDAIVSTKKDAIKRLIIHMAEAHL